MRPLSPAGMPFSSFFQVAPASVGLVDRAAGTAAVEAERLAQPLIGRGVQHVRVARIHHEIGRARERVDVEHLRPRATGVGRLEHAALGISRPEVADRRDVGDVRDRSGSSTTRPIAARVVQTEVGPRLAGVGRAIHAAAPRRALAIVFSPVPAQMIFESPREDRERAERVVGLLAEDVLPGDAFVRRSSRCRRWRRRRTASPDSSDRSGGRGCGRRWPPGRCRGSAARRRASAPSGRRCERRRRRGRRAERAKGESSDV